MTSHRQKVEYPGGLGFGSNGGSNAVRRGHSAPPHPRTLASLLLPMLRNKAVSSATAYKGDEHVPFARSSLNTRE